MYEHTHTHTDTGLAVEVNEVTADSEHEQINRCHSTTQPPTAEVLSEGTVNVGAPVDESQC